VTRFYTGNPMLEGFRIMERAWDPTNLTAVKKGQGHTRVYPACLTLYYGGVTTRCLQWWRRLDLAKGGKHGRTQGVSHGGQLPPLNF
jgi:hypothetical protein